MIRLILSLALLLAACAVLAAPAPELFKSGWDKPVDPSRDCKFHIKGGTMTIELPGGDHDLAPNRDRFNAPCLLRDVEGDFVMQVRVSGSFRPSAKSSVDEEESRVAAGIVLILADENCIRLEFGARRLGGRQGSFVDLWMGGEELFNMNLGGISPWKQEDREVKEEYIYLLLERQGDVIKDSISPDGKKWPVNGNVSIPNLPAKFKVGLAAFSTSTEPSKVRFDQFKLTWGKKKEK
jgi:regulation of enolase protein 1 (concanavalin A-like superfamily)